MSFDIPTFQKTFALFIPPILKNPASRKCCFWALGLIVVDVITAGLVPYFSKHIVDSLSLSVAVSLSFAVLFLGFFWTLEKILGHLQDMVFFPAVNNTIRDTAFNVVQHVHEVPLSTYQTLSVPEVINCIRRISFSARSFIKVLILLIIPSAIKFLIAAFVLMKLGGVGFSLVLSFSLSLWMLYKVTQWYVGTREQAWQITDQVIMRANDSLLNTKLARFFKTFELREVRGLLNAEANLWYLTNTRLHTVHVLIGLLLGGTVTFLLYYAFLGVRANTLTLGDFVMIKGQLIAAFLPFKTLSMEFRQMAESLIDIKKILQIFEIPKEKLLKLSPFKQSPHYSIVAKEISFSHDSQTALFQKLSFEIKSGEKILLNGKSGSGKSTLLGILAALYAPSQGQIFLNDQDLKTLSKEDLNRIIHFIPQDFHLFNQTLYYNLTYGLSSISNNALQKVIQTVELEELISELPSGLETIVGEMGTRLSGGEKQRVALARALLLSPKILLLDETTHSLSAPMEASILKEVFKRIPTVVLISHHIPAVQGIDRILSLERGQIRETVAEPALSPLDQFA